MKAPSGGLGSPGAKLLDDDPALIRIDGDVCEL
jgi:hypothetical protein